MILLLALITLTFGALSAPPRLAFNFKPVWEDALKAARVSHKQIACLMGVSSQHLSQQVDGTYRTHLSMFRLLWATRDEDGKRFFEELMTRVNEQIGLHDMAIQQQLAVMRGQLDVMLKVTKARQATVWLDQKKETA